MNGSASGPYTISDSHSESTPSRSSCAVTAVSASGPAAPPSPLPIRLFTFPSDHAAGPGARPGAASGSGEHVAQRVECAGERVLGRGPVADHQRAGRPAVRAVRRRAIPVVLAAGLPEPAEPAEGQPGPGRPA